ncbi:MAG: hypothetical protein SOX83_01775 [Sodaliphilus sp.]|nr:hypothetical protein [Sodaliphilus sp.]
MKRFLFKFFFVLFALIAALPAQAVTVFVKGSTSPYVKVGDSYQQLTSSVKTSDNVTWYYADVADNSTICFTTANSDSNLSPSFTVTTGSAYFYYDGNSFAVNMTGMKDKTSYCLLETSIWEGDGIGLYVWDNSANVELKFVGGNSTKHVYLYTSNNNISGTIYFKRCKAGNGYETYSEFSATYEKGAYYYTTGESSGTKANDVKTYQNIVWPEKPAPTNYTYALHGQITGNQNWESTAMTDEGNGIWSLTGDFVVGEFGIKKMTADSQTGWFGWNQLDKSSADNCEASGSNIKLTVAGNYTISFNTKTEKITVTKNSTSTDDIPVYPAGVNSETELSAYDFEANPVYYLLSTILNNNRVTPEWQMTKGADGKYHLNGFAMRNTSCRDTDGGKNVEGYIKVRQYVDATSYKEFDKQQVNDLPENPLTDGKRYNATFDPKTNKLSLTEDASAKGKMPFISLVGYMMQQDQEYTTPRGIDGKPSGTTTAKGWQEAWLQYDANGKLLKDRAGNVMYSTMWPPKNPVYFTATVGENQRLYSSDQMTFVPVKDAKGDYVGKTGAEWEKELKALDKEAYKGLDLVDDKIYYRYVVSDIWYVGAGKIWTGWGSQITYSSNNPIAQWYNHTNWGYLNKKANDTDGSLIDPETTYGVSTKDGENGNFLFENPTYFKTFEFFYENTTPSTESKIYTTRAYGSASIAAQNVKVGDSYTKGSYQATVSVPEGVEISSWTITRHDATNDALAPIGSDNGKVASYTAEKTDPTSTTFTVDEEGLGEGRYYYELTVTFSNGRTSTVRSNPFVIYFPNQYSLDANGYQLVKLDEKTADDYSYVTYNAKANGDLYFVEFTDNTVSKFRVATSAERESLNGKFAKNEGIKWTDKVFVYAPVPSEFKIDAEKASATVSLDKITSYNVNSTTGIAPVQKELAVVDLKQNFANKVYKAVMNYQQKDPAATVETWNDKISLGKENLTVMRMPNVKGGTPTVSVTCTENSADLNIDYKGTAKTHAANYYNVNVELPFSDPNVEAAVAPQYEVKVTDAKGTTTKVYTASASGTGDRAIKFSNVNPLDFAGKSIEVNAKYSDGTGYNLDANIGEAAKMASGNAKFTSGCARTIQFIAVKSKAPKTDENGNTIVENGKVVQKDVIVVSNMHYTHDGADDKIAGTDLAVANSLYNVDFTINGNAAYSNVYSLSALDFDGTLEYNPETKHHYWTASIQFDNPFNAESPTVGVAITPFYVAKVTNTEGAANLDPVDVVKAEEATTYVALPCATSDASQGGLTTGIVDITEGSNMKAYKVIENGEIYIIYGDRKFNVMGAEVK